MITISSLQKQYRDQIVLDIPELTLSDGQLIGLVGNNGAGKTTLMRCILDLIEPTHGQVTANDKPVQTDPSWKQYTGSFLDSSFLIDFYTPEEFFSFVAEVYHIAPDDMQQRLTRFESLMNGEVLGTGKVIHEFSMGNRQKIGIIAAMVIEPKVLILDEPFNYIDPSSQIIVAQLISQMNREKGTTVLISSHNLNSISDICTRIVLLEKGRLVEDIEHVPGSRAEKLEAYFMSYAQ